MKFRNDMLKFGIGLFIGMSLYHYFFKGDISTTTLISNAIGSVIGAVLYAYWTNRKTRHKIFRKKR